MVLIPDVSPSTAEGIFSGDGGSRCTEFSDTICDSLYIWCCGWHNLVALSNSFLVTD
ncbi:hypothetical protein L9F63_003035, partial [Diploptera punctata]